MYNVTSKYNMKHKKKFIKCSWCVGSPKQTFGGKYSNETRKQEINCKVEAVGNEKVKNIFQWL